MPVLEPFIFPRQVKLSLLPLTEKTELFGCSDSAAWSCSEKWLNDVNVIVSQHQTLCHWFCWVRSCTGQQVSLWHLHVNGLYWFLTCTAWGLNGQEGKSVWSKDNRESKGPRMHCLRSIFICPLSRFWVENELPGDRQDCAKYWFLVQAFPLWGGGQCSAG